MKWMNFGNFAGVYILVVTHKSVFCLSIFINNLRPQVFLRRVSSMKTSMYRPSNSNPEKFVQRPAARGPTSDLANILLISTLPSLTCRTISSAHFSTPSPSIWNSLSKNIEKEWFIEDQAFSLSYDLAPPPSPSPSPVSKLSFFFSLSYKASEPAWADLPRGAPDYCLDRHSRVSLSWTPANGARREGGGLLGGLG